MLFRHTQIKITALNSNSFKIYIFFLNKVFSNLHFNFSIIKLPATKKRITLLKSPHVNKKAREQFEIISYKALIVIKENVTLSILRLLLLNKPATIQIKLKNK